MKNAVKAFSNPTASDAETQFVNVGGVNLAYREVGSGDPIILFTRLRGTLDTWDPAFVDALADGYRVIIVDYPGVGYSEGELAPDMVAVADTMVKFAKALRISKFNLVSWSWGGAL
ncbi:MAG: alpha/beta hydrolase, partial [Rhizobium sp.]|nr:alpha/beta hydrolase [Rhizobium sp.]